MSNLKEERSAASKLNYSSTKHRTPGPKVFMSSCLPSSSPGLASKPPINHPVDKTEILQQCTCEYDREFLTLQISMRDQCIERLKEQLKKTITDISSLESKYSKLKVVSRGLQEKLSQVADELEVGKTENTSLKQCKKQLLEKSCQLEYILNNERNKLESTMTELIAVKEQQVALQDQNSELSKQLNFLKEQVVKCTTRQTATLSKLQQLYEQFKIFRPFKEKYEQLVSRQKQTLDSIEGLRTANKSLTQQLQERQQIINSLRTRMQEQSIREVQSQKSLNKQIEKNRALQDQIRNLQQEFKLQKNALQTQINFFRQTFDQKSKKDQVQVQLTKQRLNTKEVLETNMQTSRLLTQGNKQHNSPDKENRKPNQYGPTNIKVIESCATDEDHLQRRAGSIKILSKARKTCFSVHNFQSQ